jgi:3-hydroxy-9,10-secoandrosta-1,3,5(10)-triene-9,17-dione monooxygenase
MTTTELVERARSLSGLMRELAARAEESRHLVPEMVEAFTEAGFVRMMVPIRWGGEGLALTDALDVTIELARSYGSIGWVGSFWLEHARWVGFYPEEAQRAVWRDSPDARVATAFMPVGKVSPVEGGFKVSGEWSWASGVGFSDWVILGGLVPRGVSSTEYRLFLVPTSEVTVLDTWFNVGLRGSGTDNVLVADVVVPEHRTLSMDSVREGRVPGAKTNTAPHFQVPLMTHAGYAMVGPAIGIARAAIDHWSQHVRSKSNPYTGQQVAALLPIQMQLGESAALVDTAEALVRGCLERVQSGDELGIEDRVRHRRDISFAARLLTRSVDELIQKAGASALRDESSIQRCWRDVRTIACHMLLNFDAAAENYGRRALGLPLNPNDPFY